MKYICIKTAVIYLFTTLPLFASAFTQKVDITKSVMVGDRIAKFIPAGYDAKSIPSFAIDKEPREQGALPPNWELIPDFTSTNGKANASFKYSGRYKYLWWW